MIYFFLSSVKTDCTGGLTEQREQTGAPPYLFVYAMSSITRILELVDIHYQQRSVRPVEVRKETLFQTDFPIFLLPILALQDLMIYYIFFHLIFYAYA